MKRAFGILALLLLWGGVGAVPPAEAAKATKDSKDAKDGKAKKDEKKDVMASGTFSGLKFRSVGPAVTSGRVSDLAVHPTNYSIWYVAVASGGLWKTTNAGTTFSPIFDGQASFSIGCVTLDPNNPNVVWVGSGENNSQRSVAWGDGVYKSEDGGKSFKNVGLKTSEHIGKIVVDPRNSDVVYVASQGPLWGPGGERGLYKTTDGGKTWKAVLTISENTGVSDVVMDPRYPDVLYAAAYQRRRHVWTLINGGPESAIHKSTDGGATWQKLEKGLPSGNVGRIGLAMAPANPDMVYAIIETADSETRGVYRTENRGASWDKRGSHVSGSPQYYQELVVDPKNADRVYSLDTFNMISEDGGKTFKRLGEKSKHVDNHALWINPTNTDHLINGCDGGIYQSFDRGANWIFTPHLPITQFYRVEVSNDTPFYYIYGGTQDNYSLGGPSRTINAHGITNSDWFVTQGGDGFETVVDPVEPHILYAQSQHGGLVRFDRKSGENIDIQPQPGPGQPGLRWNWDSPLAVSHFSHKRLYFAANILYRSDDRGDNWRAISPDLTRQIDRDKLPVMGKVWGVDAVAKNNSTSFYGNIVAFSESPKVDGLLYVGTDDGLIQVSEDGGANWRKVETFPGVPERTFVSRLEASAHGADTVYAAFENHKNADFKPYVLKSTDRGKTWASISGDLPEKQPVYALAEDPWNPELLFAGTEFGVFFTRDGGKQWVQLKGGVPPIPVRDLAIQKREKDLVLGTFGRGFYVLDDYTPLALADRKVLEAEAPHLFPVKDALLYVEATPIGGDDKGFLGETFYLAPNPSFGATFTVYLKEGFKTRKEKRQEAEEKAEEDKAPTPYPTWEELRAEEREKDAELLLTVRDEDGQVVRRLSTGASKGFQRIPWNLRYPASTPVRLAAPERGDFGGGPPSGPMVAPGKYSVSLATVVDGKVTEIPGSQTFQVVPLNLASLGAKDREAVVAFQQKTARLQRAVMGASRAAEEAQGRLDHLLKGFRETPAADPQLTADALALEARLKDLVLELDGDDLLARRNQATPSSISDRMFRSSFFSWSVTSAPTGTHEQEYRWGAEAFGKWLPKFRQLVEGDLAALEKKAEAALTPWTPGRVPDWKPE